MTEINKSVLNFPKALQPKTMEKEVSFHRLWRSLCDRYLPVRNEESIWRYSRDAKTGEPSQGWKLHISATILEACDLFEKVAPFLISGDVQFKAPDSLDELSKINCGLKYGYQQVGKFITVYCPTAEQATRLAGEIHELTREFISISVPFDEQYLPGSSVFYRYGAFAPLNFTDKDGRILPALKNAEGELVYDDRFQAVPGWIDDPFQKNDRNSQTLSARDENPLKNTYRVFRALTQRGKGGVYQALDLSVAPPRLCIIKEGRRHGEVMWDGQDGRSLIKNEFYVLNALRKNQLDEAPQIFSSFELSENCYLAMEYVEGISLHNLMKPRRRRFSLKKVLLFAIEIAGIIEKIHQAGWIWNDCKPANLIVTRRKTLRPIDFENSYPVNQSSLFDWKTQGFSKSFNNRSSIDQSGKHNDLYALGAVIYFLLTGKLYDDENPISITKLRRNVSPKLIEIVEKMLADFVSEKQPDVSAAKKELREILNRL